jgi:hypothetical protein
MVFLRRLAPQRPDDPTRAVAALPSRYETERPLYLADEPQPQERDGSPPRDRTPDAMAFQRRGVLPLPAPDPKRPASAADATVRLRPAVATGGAELGPLPVREAPGLPRPRSGSTQATLGATRIRDTGQADEVSRSRDLGATTATPRPPRHPHATGDPAPHPTRVAAAPGSSDVGLSVASPIDGRVSAAGAPLSERAMSARSTAEVNARPIVHVTIDRVDVRASGAVRPPAPRPRTMPARHTRASLTDYLRGRGRGGAR